MPGHKSAYFEAPAASYQLQQRPMSPLGELRAAVPVADGQLIGYRPPNSSAMLSGN